MEKLNAVNEMLRALPARPVTSLTDPENVNASLASTALDETLDEVLQKGYRFNTEERELVRDEDGKYPIPSSVLSVEIVSPLDASIAQSGQYLYDFTNDTDVFTVDVCAKLVYRRSFADLPFPVANYIVKKAKRRFKRDIQGPSQADSFLAQEEQEAMVELNRYDIEARKLNLIDSSNLYRSIVGRRQNPPRRW